MRTFRLRQRFRHNLDRLRLQLQAWRTLRRDAPLWTTAVVVLMLFFTFCERESTGGDARLQNNDAALPPIQYDNNPRIQAAARFLAGRELPRSGAGQELAKLAGDARYERYRKIVRGAWERYETRHLDKLREWSRAENLRSGATLFYPFSGPDATHAAALFPDAERYILIGLEPVGFLPEPARDAPGRVLGPAGLAQMYRAVEDVLGRNFFKTLDMAEEIGGTEYSGVAAILLFFLGNLEAELLDAYYVEITPEGAERRISADAAAPGAGKQAGGAPRAVRFVFRWPDSDRVRQLTYHSLNLADVDLEFQPGVKEWLAGLGPKTTMLKAASFLMYRSSFDGIRQVVLGSSDRILLDSSGFPFYYLNEGGWTTQLYGDYTRPVGLFAERFEPEMYRVYRERDDVQPLPFDYGYNTGGTSHLILAERVPEENPRYAPQWDGSKELGESARWNGRSFERLETYAADAFPHEAAEDARKRRQGLLE